MSLGGHDHDWQYGEAKEMLYNNQFEWIVVRFCPRCLEVEEVKLHKKYQP